MRKEVIGNATLYLGDCLEILPSIKYCANCVAPPTCPRCVSVNGFTLITDPPYGIGMKWKGVDRNNRHSGLAWKSSGTFNRQPEWTDIVGDDKPFDPLPWLAYPQVILWGANNYSGLPAARRWLVWDKRRDTTPDNHGDAELAWTNLDGVIRTHRQVWRGIVREGEENVAKTSKSHPTQKPIELMRWCVDMTTGNVLDPFMGSGSTGVACMNLQRPFIGIEIEPKYFDIACERITNAQRQERMFA